MVETSGKFEDDFEVSFNDAVDNDDDEEKIISSTDSVTVVYSSSNIDSGDDDGVCDVSGIADVVLNDGGIIDEFDVAVDSEESTGVFVDKTPSWLSDTG